MKHRNDKERMADRREFVYMHREEIQALMDIEPPRQWNPKAREFVDRVVRPVLPYSSHTYFFDIMMSLMRTYNKIFPKNESIEK